jgi:hypothetical protein
MADDFKATVPRYCHAQDLTNELHNLIRGCHTELSELGALLDDDDLSPSDRALYERYYERNKAIHTTATRCQDQVQAAVDALLDTWRTTDDPVLQGLMQDLDTWGTLTA